MKTTGAFEPPRRERSGARYNDRMTVDRREIVAYLRSVPDEAEAVCAGLSDEQMRRRPGADEWSLIELVCHLRDWASEEGVRIRRLVEEDNPTLVPYDEQAWAAERRYREEDVRRGLTAMRAYCTGLAYQLEGLPDEQWERPGFHPEMGRVTVRSRAEAQVAHARDHLAQMREVREMVDA